MKNDAGEMSVSEDSKQKAWLEHYQRLLNVEFDWDPDHLSYQPPVEGLPIPITIDMVKKATSQMKAGICSLIPLAMAISIARRTKGNKSKGPGPMALIFFPTIQLVILVMCTKFQVSR